MIKDNMKSLSRGMNDDMTPKAISARLDIASQLIDLAQSLSKAKKITRTKRMIDPSKSKQDSSK